MRGVERIASPDGLVRDADSPDITRVAAIIMAMGPGQLAAVTRQNDQLFELVHAHSKLFAVASVHPYDGAAAVEELARIKARGAKMLKLHYNTQKFDIAAPEVAVIVAKAAELDLPILFEGTALLDPAAIGKYVILAAQHPKAKIVLAHMGGTAFRDMLYLKAITAYPWFPRNVWVDLSFTSHMFVGSPVAPELVWVARQIGVDHVLFGSDFPVVTTEQAIADVERLGFTEAELRRIFYDNAHDLLGL